MIEVDELVKDYGTVVAVRGLSFRVGKGEIVGFLGPNGAGKSTTLRMIAGFLGATSGTVRVNGYDVLEEPLGARRSIGYMPEAAPLYPEMRVREFLRFRAELKGVPRRERVNAVDRAMTSASVKEMADTLIQHLSKGYRQRVGLADALVSNPPLLILDEPTAGLDPNQIRDVRNLIRSLGKSHTILLSTHILSEVETTCDRAVVIDRGKLVAEGTIAELTALRRASAATLVVTDPEQGAAALAKAVEGVSSVKDTAIDGSNRRRLVLELGEGDTTRLLESVIGALVTAGIGVSEATLSKASLEDVFVQLTVTESPEKGAEGP